MGILEKNISRRLKNRTAWITGGKRVGQVVAQALAEQGVHIVVTYRSSKQEAEAIASAARHLGVRSLAIQADVSRRESAAQAVQQIVRAFKRIDILINMASVFGAVDFEKITLKDWESNYAAHVLGTFWPIQLVQPFMPRGGHIVNVTDRTTVGKVYPRFLPYVVTKTAVAGLTRASAKELAQRGIFVNAIAPGPILKPDFMTKTAWEAGRKRSPIRFPISDQEAMEQFALLVGYLSVETMTSGNTYSLDQGFNL